MKKGINAVIIEDEHFARQALKQDIQNHFPEIEIRGMASGVVSGAKLIRKYQPDLIFLDIELEDGIAFDLIEIMDSLEAGIIFTTGSEEYAIKAFRIAAIDYLIKPIQIDQLKEAIEKFHKFRKFEKPRIDLLRSHIQEAGKTKKIALNTQEKISIVENDKIIFCTSNGNYTQFHLEDGSKILVARTLKEFEFLLGERDFLRPHQSHLVNINHIKEYVKKDGGYLKMSDGELIPVSFRKRSIILKAIGLL